METRLATHAQLLHALEELVKLSSHYAQLLNQYDGGERFSFANAQAWLDRLDELGELPRDGSAPA